MSAPLTPEQAAAEGYVPVERWEVSEVMQFIRRELGGRTYWLIGHTVLLAVLVLLALYRGYLDISAGAHWFADVVIPLGGGLALMVVVIVPHELIHGLAYRLAGATRVVYGADWRRLVFHASAPGFVVDYRRMKVVALAPFVIISFALGYYLLITEGSWWWLGFGVAIMHTQGCIGDAAMLNVFARQRDPAAWVTYDDAAERQFVFLRKPTLKNEKGATKP